MVFTPKNPGICARCKKPITDDQEWQYYQGRFWHEDKQEGCEGFKRLFPKFY